MSDQQSGTEVLAEYHPFELPPRAWHVGPSESERDARGLAYFKVGRNGVESISRNPVTGDVYIRCLGGSSFVHTRLGWALIAGGAKQP